VRHPADNPRLFAEVVCSSNAPTSRKNISAPPAWLFYPNVLNDAEFVSGPYGQLRDYTPPLSDAQSVLKLVTTLGRGIGNTAAHETGHQISFAVPLPGMECGPGTNPPKNCENGVNSVYESASQGEWDFLPINPPIAWEPTDQKVLQNYLKCTANACP
jgi:hypothetical protein